MRRFWVVLVLLTVAVCPAMAAGYRTSVGTGADEIPVVVVWGTPYEMGYSYGSLMPTEVSACISRFLAYAQAYDPVRYSNANLDAAWALAEPYISGRFIEEMHGVADGAGVSYDAIRRIHSVPLVLSYACSGVAVWGAATANGHLYQIRNLDWVMDAGLQDYPVIVVYLPRTGVAHANVAFAGWVGSNTGMNAAGVALTEKGETPDSDYPFDYEAVPFFVMFRDILQDCETLDQVITHVTSADRSKRYYYVMSDGDEPAAVKMRAFAPGLDIWYDNDPTDELYPNVLPNVVYVTMNNAVAWNHLNANYGDYDADLMIELSQLVHGGSLMYVVYDATAREMWVAYAEGSQPAYQREYVHFNLNDYLAKSVSAPDRVACPGSTLAVPISIDNPTLVAAAQIDLRYDPNIVTALAVEKGDLVAGDPHWQLSSQISSGRAQAIIYNDQAVPLAGGSGSLVIVNFAVNPAAAQGQVSPLTLAKHILSDARGNELPSQGQDGSLTIIPVHHFVFDSIVSPQGGDLTHPLPFEVRVEARDASNALVSTYNGTADLTSSVGTAAPATIAFTNGVAQADVTILADLDPDCTLTVTDAGVPASGTSNVFALRGKGDPTSDGAVNVLDVMRTVNIVLGNPVPQPPRYEFQYWAADMNDDGEVNVQDIILIINKIFSASGMGKVAAASAAAQISAEPVTVAVEPARGGAWTIRVSNAAGLAGAQFEIACKQGEVAAGELAAAAGWQVQSNWINGHPSTGSGQALRVLAFSPSATGLTAGDGALLRLTNVRGKPKLVSTLLCDAAGREIAVR